MGISFWENVSLHLAHVDKSKGLGPLDKYAGLEREASLADLVFAVYIERRLKFAALMLLRLSRASEIGGNCFHS